LAALLDAASDVQWDPSLCEGWRVREVVAHLRMPARYGGAFMAELRDSEFDFTRLSNRIASQDAQLPTAELVDNLRDEAMHHWTPPGGGYHGAGPAAADDTEDHAENIHQAVLTAEDDVHATCSPSARAEGVVCRL
jgi:hypothetical protein